MTTYVLVHGAWSGANGFRHVRRRLQAAGHEVFTPSLTGIGERSHLMSPMVGLSTHVRDIVHQILYEDLQGIVLLGFSYGGFVVTGALEHIGERVRHLVYLDAFVPERDGDSVAGLRGMAPAVIELGESWLLQPMPRDYDDPAEAEWMAARRGPQPRRSFTEPVRLPRPVEDYPFTRTYIKATGDARLASGPDPFWQAADRVRGSAAWRYREIATGHMVASNRPAELTAMLLELGAGSSAS